MKLTSPRLFQRNSDGLLDLQCLNPPNPGNQGDEGDPVVVSILLPNALEDHVTVWFGSASKNFPIANPKRVIIDCAFLRSELPAIGSTYDVSYAYGGQHSPAIAVKLIDSMAAFAPRHIVSANGVYPPGSTQHPALIDVWAVPSFRLLLKNDPIIAPIADNPVTDVALKLVWKPFSGRASEVGDIVFDASQGLWRVSLNQACLTLQRFDSIVTQSMATVQQTLAFSLLL